MKCKIIVFLNEIVICYICILCIPHTLFSKRQDRFLIDTCVTSNPGIGEQRDPHIASDGLNYMLVYVDYRNGTPRVLGTIIDQQGMSITPEGFSISRTSTCGQTNPVIIHNGNNYFVAWQEIRNCYYEYWYLGNYDICCARIDNSGFLIDSFPIVLTKSTETALMPAVAYNGENYLVTWISRADTGGICARRINNAGVILDTLPIIVEGHNNYFFQYAAVSSADSNFFVIWNRHQWREYSIQGARVSNSGQVIDTTAIEIFHDTTTCSALDIASDSSNYQIVFQKRRYGENHADILGIRVNNSGAVIDTVPFAISSADSSQNRPAIVGNGSEYLVTWEDRRNGYLNYDIYAARINNQGQVIDTLGIAVCSNPGSCQQKACVAASSGQWLVAWEDRRNTQYYRSDIYSARLSSSGNVLDPQGIDMRNRWAGQQICPDIAYNAANYLCVWNECRNSGLPDLFSEVYGIRIDPSGQILDTSAIIITQTNINNQSFPKIASDGTNYFVVWCDLLGSGSPYCSRILGKRISSEGTILDTNIVIADSTICQERMIDTYYGDSSYIVIWDGWSNRSSNLCGVMVRPDGQVLDSTRFSIECQPYEEHREVAISFDGDNFFIVFSSYKHYFHIRGIRINQQGINIDKSPILISRIPNNRLKATYDPDIAFDGDSIYLVAWSDIRNSTGQLDSIDIYSARVTKQGRVLDTNNVRWSFGNGFHSNPSVIFDGQNFFAVWEDSRNGDSCDIHGAIIDPDMNILQSGPVIIQPGDQFDPALIKGNNQILLCYSGWTDSINSHVGKIQRIWAEIDPTIGSEERNILKVNSINNLALRPSIFRQKTAIEFSIAKSCASGHVEIYDISGRQIWCSNDYKPGDHRIEWCGCDSRNRELPSGIYLCRLVYGEKSVSEKFVFLK